MLRYVLAVPEKRLKDVRCADPPVALLVRFHNSNEQTRERNAGTVQYVDEVIFLHTCGAVSGFHTTSLKIPAIRAGGDFEPSIHAGAINLDIHCLSRCECHIAG